MRTRSKWGARLGKLGWIPAGMFVSGPALWMIAEPLGPESDAAVILWLLGVVLVALAIPLILAWCVAWVVFRVVWGAPASRGSVVQDAVPGGGRGARPGP